LVHEEVAPVRTNVIRWPQARLPVVVNIVTEGQGHGFDLVGAYSVVLGGCLPRRNVVRHITRLARAGGRRLPVPYLLSPHPPDGRGDRVGATAAQ
jgi:hypothetical protein